MEFPFTYKQHVPSTLQSFFAYVTNHFQTTIKTIRTDNGTEFFNSQLGPFLLSHGALHQQYSCTDTQQNGRAERKHIRILELTRALRFQSGLPLRYWGDCLMTATYLINRIPTPVLSNSIHLKICIINDLYIVV